MTFASILFFFNRYIALVYYVDLPYYFFLSLPYPVKSSFAANSFLCLHSLAGVSGYTT